jgi:hypothetical protein
MKKKNRMIYDFYKNMLTAVVVISLLTLLLIGVVSWMVK